MSKFIHLKGLFLPLYGSDCYSVSDSIMERISPEIDLLFKNEDFYQTQLQPPNSICRNSHFNTLRSNLTEKQTEKKRKNCQSHLGSNNHNLLFGWNTPLIHGFRCENILALNAVFPRCFSNVRSCQYIFTSNVVSAMIYRVGESNTQTWIPISTGVLTLTRYRLVLVGQLQLVYPWCSASTIALYAHFFGGKLNLPV